MVDLGEEDFFFGECSLQIVFPFVELLEILLKFLLRCRKFFICSVEILVLFLEQLFRFYAVGDLNTNNANPIFSFWKGKAELRCPKVGCFPWSVRHRA